MKTLTESLGQLIDQQAEALGADLEQMRGLLPEAAMRTAHLANIAGEPGADRAVRAEVDAMRIEAAIQGSQIIQTRVAGFFQGAMATLANVAAALEEDSEDSAG